MGVNGATCLTFTHPGRIADIAAMKPELLKFGVTEAEYKDCKLQIFDRDRLICECVFYENKMDRESYNKAIQGYVADPKKNVSRLLEYAEKRRVLKRVKDRIGVWL